MKITWGKTCLAHSRYSIYVLFNVKIWLIMANEKEVED